MPQVLKGEVQGRLRAAAREAFAQHGYAAAGVAEIARRAGVSAGNVYRYFPDKAALFAAVLPAELVDRFRGLLQEWAAADGALAGPRLTAAGGGFDVSARPLVDFILAHRLEVVILLGQATGTPYSGFPEEAAQRLVSAVQQQLQGNTPDRGELPPPLRFALEEIQRSYVWALVRILETFTGADDVRRALSGYERYHRAGLRALLAPGTSPRDK